MIFQYSNYDEMPTLRTRCEYLSEIWGRSVWPVHTVVGHCDLRIRHGQGRTNTLLLSSMKIEIVRGIVEWEIAKAEGQLRDVA
jgi:hypothetical protein